jgi:hypothetical protein
MLIMSASELKRQLKDVPDDSNVALCVEDFPYAALYGVTSFDAPRENGEVGTLLISLHPQTDVANYLRQYQKPPVEEHKYRMALLHIGAQHPAWSARKDDKLVAIFNRVTAEAREAVGAIGADDDAKADWCANAIDPSDPENE